MHIDDDPIEELIVRAARGEATSNELETLEQWRRRSPHNERRHRELTSLLGAVLQLRTSAETTPPSARAIIQEAERRETAAPLDVGRRTRKRTRVWMGGAAAAAACLAIGWALQHWAPRIRAHAGAATPLVYETGSGQARTFQLGDGTLVHLAGSSRLEARFDQPDTELRLDGRAFFGVPRQNGRRVVVEADAGRITVLGTRFEVRSGGDDLELLVVDGRVSVGPPENAVEIGPGIRGVVRGNVISAVEQVEDPLDELAWMGRAMVFQSTPLDRVVAEIERRYEIEIDILAPEVSNRTLTTAFDGESAEEVMDIVCRVVQVECVWRQERVVIEA